MFTRGGAAEFASAGVGQAKVRVSSDEMNASIARRGAQVPQHQYGANP